MTATNVNLSVNYTTPTTKSAAGGVYTGNGAPTFAATKGSLYVQLDATTTTSRLWINEDGSTTWAYFTTSA